MYPILIFQSWLVSGYSHFNQRRDKQLRLTGATYLLAMSLTHQQRWLTENETKQNDDMTYG